MQAEEGEEEEADKLPAESHRVRFAIAEQSGTAQGDDEGTHMEVSVPLVVAVKQGEDAGAGGVGGEGDEGGSLARFR